MNKTTINVPKGIKFLLDWNEFNLPEYPIILNKQITGCGFTEWCIRNDKNIILCSPRRILLENKTEQHPYKVLYLNNSLEHPIVVDEDLNKPYKSSSVKHKELTKEQKLKAQETISEMKDVLMGHYFNHSTSRLPCKILVTYDSFRHVKEALGYRIKDFYVVIDEFQSIFTDSRFKSGTELEFINQLKDLNRVSFVSATPYIDTYLDQLDEFKDLPYYELDWGALDPGRIIRPEVSSYPTDSILTVSKEEVQRYLNGDFEKYVYRDEYGDIRIIESKELVIYVNSVKNICDIIVKCGLTLENTNVLCANYPENLKKVRKAFGLKPHQKGGIGKVPKRDEPRKMFTLCTRTVYLGADFYSDNARTLILSDANLDCLAVDIRVDIPQIMGRQRLFENPWKNRAILYFKSSIRDKDDKNLSPNELFMKYFQIVIEKKNKTEKLLSAYNKLDIDEQKELAEVYLDRAITKKYRDDYVAVNTHDKLGLVPVFNNLAMVSDIRGYELKHVIYDSNFSVVNNIRNDQDLTLSNSEIYEFLEKFNGLTKFTDKMKLLCDSVSYFSGEDLSVVLSQIDIMFGNYYNVLGPVKIKSLWYQKSKLEEEFNKLINNQNSQETIINCLISKYIPGNKYLLSEIKIDLIELFNMYDIKEAPKASFLERFFELKKVLITNKVTGKRDSAYEILKLRDF